MQPTNLPKIFRGSPYYYEKVKGVTFGQKPLDFLSLNLPPICNYRCSFCFAAGTQTDQSRLREIREKSLTNEDYTRIIAEAGLLGTRHIEVSGEGEPDLPIFRDTLTHILRVASEHDIHTTVFANGSWVDDRLLGLLNENDASLVISIKYTDPIRYDNTVGIRGIYERVRRNIENSRQVIGNPEVEHGFAVYRLALFSGVFEDNNRDNDELRRYCDENNIFFSLSTRIPQGKSEGIQVDYESQEAEVERYTHGSIILADSSKKELGFSVCGTFYYGLGINFDGEVVFDAHASDTVGMIGNIRELGLKNAVERHRELRRAFYEGGGSSYCPLRDESYGRFIGRYGKERL